MAKIAQNWSRDLILPIFVCKFCFAIWVDKFCREKWAGFVICYSWRHFDLRGCQVLGRLIFDGSKSPLFFSFGWRRKGREEVCKGSYSLHQPLISAQYLISSFNICNLGFELIIFFFVFHCWFYIVGFSLVNSYCCCFNPRL